MVAADNNTPYMLCGGLQDNNAWCGPSSSVGGGGGGGGGAGVGINGSEWFTVTGGDGEYAVPAPTDSSILYVDSQNGNITRVDLKTGLNRSIRPYLSGVKDTKPANLQYRFNWTSPIAVSPRDANTVYMGGNVVFRSPDGGDRWATISPDVTRNDKTKQVTSGGPINYDISGAETYNTILTVNLAPTDANVIWLGTDAALWYSRDGGATWKPLKADFPTVPVYDLQFIKRSHDLVVATHGRGLFVLDNVTALEELTPEVAARDLHVFSTLAAQIRVRPRRTGVAPTRFTTPNASAGAVIDYYLKTVLDTGSTPQGEGAQGESQGRSRRGRAIVTVTDSRGDTVVVDSSAPGKQGVNRYVWVLRYAGPTRLTFERPPTGEEEENPFRNVLGPRVGPGTYSVALTAGGRTATTKVTVEPDPVLGGDPARFAAQLRAGLEWRNALSALNRMLNRIASLETQLKNAQQALRENMRGDTTATAPVARQARELGRKLKELKDSLYNSDVQRDAGQDDIHYLNRFQDRLQGLGFGLGFAYACSQIGRAHV